MSFSLCGGAASKRANGGVMMHVADNPSARALRAIRRGTDLRACRQAMTDSRVPLGHHIIQATAGAATAVGTAVGLAVSVPVAVIDPHTRDTLGHHVDGLARSVSDVVAQ